MTRCSVTENDFTHLTAQVSWLCATGFGWATTHRMATTKKAVTSLSFDDAMAELERAGSAQTRKIYLRHGASEPLFGVSFATLKTLVKRIGVDHALAHALWKSGNHDAQTLAVKVADPAKTTVAELNAWAGSRWSGYVAMLAAESPHGWSRVKAWLASKNEPLRVVGWKLAGHLAVMDESSSDDWFLERVAEIERTIHDAPNAEREAMNEALINIGGRSAALRKVATAAGKRIGTVEVDHGDTSCQTPDAPTSIEKMWAWAKAKRFDSPAAQERAREPMRTRC